MTGLDPERDIEMQGANRRLKPQTEAVTAGGTDFVSSILAGLFLGLFFDWLLGTAPLMVIAWSLAGFGIGFYRMWQRSADVVEEGRERSHGV